MTQELIQQIVETAREVMNGIHTACPGKIVSYDSNTGLATVQPILKFVKPDGETMDYPPIPGVPVLMPQGNGQKATIAFPVKPDDGCLVIISEQSLDYWMYGQETSTNLKYDLTNAVCIPGLFSPANPIVSEACKKDSIVIGVNSNKVYVGADGISIKGDVKIDGALTVKGNFTTSDGIVKLN